MHMKSSSMYLVGYQALISMFDLRVIPHYRTSYVALTGAKRHSIEHNRTIYVYPKKYALKDQNDPFEHLEFALKHEGMNLSIIKSVFEKLPAAKITKYIRTKLPGKAQCKIWYLFEFLMQKKLKLSDLTTGNYIDLLDPTEYYTADPIKIKRQRINDNMLGFVNFCPFVRRTASLAAFEKKHFDRVAKKLLDNYEPLIIQRAAKYLYTKETLSSWRIEHEEPSKTRAANFTKSLREAHYLGTLTKKKLLQVQHIIVEAPLVESDYRISQNYIGQTIRANYPIIHYISPSPKDVPAMMHDLLACLERMIASHINPVVIAATISFGFVFIHPFEDGNGRLHRFLIHYILTRTSFTPLGIIFPISAIILADRMLYDQILETFSQPLMDILEYDVDSGGIMKIKNNDPSLYAYLDYTQYAEYLFACIDRTINTDFKNELDFIIRYDQVIQAIQEIVDIPDRQLDLLIKMIIQNNGVLSPIKRKKLFSALTDNEIKKIESIVKKSKIGQLQ